MIAREVYRSALCLLQENEDDTSLDTALFEESAPRLLSLLCVLLDEVDLHVKGRRFHENALIPREIRTLDDEVPLHPVICAGALPLGLAFLLISEEDQKRASLFFNLFQTEKDNLIRRFKRGRRHKISSVY